MTRMLGSLTIVLYRALFFVIHSLLLFFAKSLKNAKNSGVKYFDFSLIPWDLRRSDIPPRPVEHWHEPTPVEDGADGTHLVGAEDQRSVDPSCHPPELVPIVADRR